MIRDPEVAALVARVVAGSRRRLGADYLATYVWGSHARGDAIETSDIDVGAFVRGTVPSAKRARLTGEIACEAGGDLRLDFAVVCESDLDGRDAVSFRHGALRIDGEDLAPRVALPDRRTWETLAAEAALEWVARTRPAPLRIPVEPVEAGDEFLGYCSREGALADGTTFPITKEALSVAGRIATAEVAWRSGRLVGDRPQAIRAHTEDVGDATSSFLAELAETLRTRWRYRVPADAADRRRLRSLCEGVLAYERRFADDLRAFLAAGREDDPPEVRARFAAMRARMARAEPRARRIRPAGRGGPVELRAMSTMTAEDLLAQLRWRYAVKAFDADRKIPAETWRELEEALVLSPSSYGLQPWRFLVVDDPAVRAKLRLVSWNQGQVTDASHYVVFAAKDHVAESDVDRFVARTAEVRGVATDALAPMRKMMIGDLVLGPRSKVIAEWAARQTYIALGNFMTSAAALGIDTCPMEGLDPQKYDEILSLGGSGFHTVVACAAGYRSAADKYARAVKVRYPLEDVIRHV